ncbi:MAG: hypothetical protein WED05_02645 [Candidatus Atabeyarchaeum deiterrae]
MFENIDWQDILRRVIGSIIMLITMPPLAIALITGVIGIYLNYLCMNIWAIVASVSIIIFVVLVGLWLFDSKLQTAILGGTIAVMVVTASLILFGFVGIGLSLLNAQWGALGEFAFMIILVVLALIFGNSANWSLLWKTGG